MTDQPDKLDVKRLELMLGKDAELTYLTKWQIIRCWEMGIFNDLAYLYLLLRYELTHRWSDRLNRESGGEFNLSLELSGADIDYLRQEWRGETEKNERGDVKELTYDKFSKAIAALHSKEAAISYTKQLTLHFSNEIDIAG